VGADPVERLADMDRDGIDIEVIFPNKGLAMWATPDSVFAMAQCRVYNDWAHETFGRFRDRMAPAAALATGDLEGSIAEVKRVAKLGFRLLTLPCKPIWGGHDVDHPNYNLPMFDPLWTVIQDVNLPATFHVSTGRDPRAARGNGGAVINYVSHSLSPTIEPVANLCASGVFERFPRLRAATIEAGIGWIAWFLGAMDEAYKKHHFWVRPKLKRLPSEYYREHCWASFQEDPGSRSPSPCTWPTASCGVTTTRTTRAPGRTRLRLSSAPWATCRRPRGPTCSGSTRRASSPSRCRRGPGPRDHRRGPRASRRGHRGPSRGRARDGHPRTGRPDP
jgi:predicted TIM-barrel fold metal-dependent hydrolase